VSTLKVEVVRVDDVLPHPNADRLEIVAIRGWNCVVRKGEWQPGDLGIYFPIDSVLSPEVESAIFPPDSKIKLNNSRVRTIKLRGAISQGLLVSLKDINNVCRPLCTDLIWQEGDDLTPETGTTKYEPPDPQQSLHGSGASGKRKKSPNPCFHRYTDMENFKNNIHLFEVGEGIIVQEKIHGTNFRAGWVPYHADTWWKKAASWLGLTPTWEFVYGSHNVQLQNRFLTTTFRPSKNVYVEAVNNYDLKKRIPKGYVVYGEIYGVDIQKGYAYGMEAYLYQRAMVAFDVKGPDEKYLHYDTAHSLLISMGIPCPPELYRGIYHGVDQLDLMRRGPSRLGKQEHREGIVIRSWDEQVCYLGRKMLKHKNDEFLALFEDDTH
jgi:RNA ligase (TIGR02306 family)